MQVTKSTCPYCGVGCGVIIESHGPQITGVRGDPTHPANFGRLCTKGSTLHLTASSPITLQTRLLQPLRRAQRSDAPQPLLWDAALGLATEKFADIIQRHGPNAVGFYVSGQLLTEDYCVFNKLAKGLIGTNNIDSNSRLCMSSAVAAYKATLGSDAVPCSYEDIDLSDLMLITGANPAYAHPVLFRRIEAARAANPELKLIVVDPRRTDTAAEADLHLAITPGSDVLLYSAMLHVLLWEGLVDSMFIAEQTTGFDDLRRQLAEFTPGAVAAACGVKADDIVTAARWFGQSKAPLSFWCQGLNQSIHGTNNGAALIHLHLATGKIGKPGMGPFSLTGQPNAMGGREAGAMANLLPGHRDLASREDRAELAALWGIPALPEQPGKTAVELFDAVRDGSIKAIWIACTNPAHSLPDLNRVREALDKAEFVVVQDAWGDTETTAFADLLLPATTWGEKDGTVTNSERRVSRVRAAVPPPGEARADWRIARDFALVLGGKLSAFRHPGAQPHLPLQGLPYAHIFIDRQASQKPALVYGGERLQTAKQGDGAGFALAGVSLPSAQTGNDPGGPSQRGARMRILLLFRLSLQRGLNVLQYLNLACIERVGGRAGRPTLACQRQLHDAHRRRERHHHQFLQPDAVLKLARLDVQSLPFDRAEGLFNMPALAIPTDAPARFLQRAHGVRGQQPPMNRRFVTDHGRGVFDDIDHVQRQVRRGLLVGAIPGLFERYRAETNMQQCFMGAALGRDGQGDPVTTLYGLLIHPVEQGHVTDRGQVAIAAGADQQVRARIRYAVPQLVDVGFPIGDRGDCGRFRQPFFAGYHGVDPAHAFLFFNRELFVMGRFPLRALPQVQVGQSKTGAFVGIDRQQRVNKKTQITSVAHRPQSVDASAMALQVDFAAVLDRQDMPSLAARIRAGTGAGNQFLGAHARVGQKSAETNFPSPVPAQLSKAYVLSADQLLMQFRSRFFKRASPKPPSAYRSIRSSCPIRSILLTSQIKLGRRKHSPCRRCVHTVALEGEGRTFMRLPCTRPPPDKWGTSDTLSAKLTRGGQMAPTNTTVCRFIATTPG